MATLTGRAAVRAQLSSFIANPPIPTLNQVWTSFPKNINFDTFKKKLILQKNRQKLLVLLIYFNFGNLKVA